jgi:hypothetical protein
MKRVINALKSTAITMGISALIGTAIFCMIRFLNPEMAMATIFMLCTIFIFTLHYKK